MNASPAVLAVVTLLALTGCGGGAKLDEQMRADWKVAIDDVQWCADHDFTGTWPETEYKCQGDASSDTLNVLIGSLDQWKLKGKNRDELLRQAADELEGYCSECVSILDREREG